VDEADHVARVIRSLSDANIARVSDIIAWLDLHQDDGRVFAATVDHEAGLDALRSGELADRLGRDCPVAERPDHFTLTSVRSWEPGR